MVNLITVHTVLNLFTLTLACYDPDYLAHLRNQVRPFYEFKIDSNGFNVAHPLLPYSRLEVKNGNTHKTTCPWRFDIDVKSAIERYPNVISIAKMVETVHVTNFISSSDVTTTCLSYKNGTYERLGRHNEQICQAINIHLPVVVKAGCDRNVYKYVIQYEKFPVAFTCMFNR